MLRPAFVVTGCVTALGCGEPTRTSNPPEVAVTSPPEETAAPNKAGPHPVDADGRLIQRKSDGTCYVQVEKKEPPPKDLMSGERWVDDKAVPCPKEFDEPGVGAIPDGYYWTQDATTGECFHAASFGNPPPPPKKVECPPSMKKK